jgi:hypothetical protein
LSLCDNVELTEVVFRHFAKCFFSLDLSAAEFSAQLNFEISARDSKQRPREGRASMRRKVSSQR